VAGADEDTGERLRARGAALARIKPQLQVLEYWGFRAIAGLARALPLKTASDVSGTIWRLIAPRLRRHERARRNIAASLPELTEDQREAILRDMWEVLGRTFAEAFHLDRIAAQGRIEMAIPDEVREILSSRNGCVLASLHMGNWEVATMGAMQVGARPAGVYQRVKNPLVDAYVTRLRDPYYPAGLFSKGHDTVMRLLRIIGAGGSVAILADLRDMRGVSVPFFGRPAPSTPFPALLARSRNVPLIAARVIRLPGVRFRIEGALVALPRTASREADVEAGTALLQALFERWIRDNPGQWMWGHRRWG
jgi:KDO2-lipid IV(A) lauroyltransferase